MRGLDHSTLAIEAEGAVGDREFVVVDEAGQFLSQRILPRLAAIGAVRVGETLRLEFEGRRLETALVRGEEADVTVFTDKIRGRHVSREADDFVSAALGRPLRVFRYQPEKPRVRVAPSGDEFVTRFADAAQVLLVNGASIAELAKHAGMDVPAARFRANVVVDGFPAWSEESWKRVRLGDLELEITKPCARCKIITIDQWTGSEGPRVPLEILKTGPKGEQPKSILGMYLRVLRPGSVKVGDPVEAF